MRGKVFANEADEVQRRKVKNRKDTIGSNEREGATKDRGRRTWPQSDTHTTLSNSVKTRYENGSKSAAHDLKSNNNLNQALSPLSQRGDSHDILTVKRPCLLEPGADPRLG
jgi:hypothetical protein